MNRRRVVAYYSGRVQGVGFRYAVKSLVAGFDVCGWVRNLDDGRVELLAEGEQQELNDFLEAIRGSGVGGFIRDADVRWSASIGGLAGFHIAERAGAGEETDLNR